ncbi:MAG: RecX family transcriptional regulator [bacterium]
MAIITRLVQGKKNPNRVNLYLDGSFAFALSIDEVGRHNLKKGLELSDTQISDLKQADDTEYLFGKILNFLSFRPRTEKEVRDRLKKYQLDDLIEQNALIDRLKAKGYLDDLAFARWFIDSRNAHRPRSPRMLAAELASKGVSREVINSLMSEVSDESDSIRRVLTKKLGSSRPLDMAERQKISAHLGRLGYSWDKIKEVVKTWQSE